MKEVRVKKEEKAKREEMKKRRKGEEGNEKVKRKKSK